MKNKSNLLNRILNHTKTEIIPLAEVTQTVLVPGITAAIINADANIRHVATSFAIMAVPSRISRARNVTFAFVDSTPYNNIPFVAVTVSCKGEDQFCSRCGSFGCPGGC